MTDTNIIDLDSQRATRREAKGKAVPVIFGGETIAELPVELPLEVFEPIKALDLDIALLIRQAMDVMNAQGDEGQRSASISLIVDLLVNRPSLPTELIDAGIDMGKRLLGEEGFAKFVAQKPSREDVSAFIGGVFQQYGVSLGEALAPSEQQEGSTPAISKRTSKRSTKSTSVASGRSPRKTASSGSGGS